MVQNERGAPLTYYVCARWALLVVFGSTDSYGFDDEIDQKQQAENSNSSSDNDERGDVFDVIDTQDIEQ